MLVSEHAWALPYKGDSQKIETLVKIIAKTAPETMLPTAPSIIKDHKKKKKQKEKKRMDST